MSDGVNPLIFRIVEIKRTAMPPTAKFEKDLAFLRSWLLGKEWWTAHGAMEFARRYHSGLRKDGATPEFHHQVQIALNGRTLVPFFLFPEETIAVCFLHDVLEDFQHVTRSDIERDFGSRIATASELLAKKQRNSRKDYADYFADLAADPIASAVKGLDRCHNIWTMRGVFDREKRELYVDEIDRWFLPMLKAARKRFPQQEPCYQNIAQQLRSMRDIYRWAHDEIDGSTISADT
jgi:(p)ppGpp synthase/HD superfamily hydrolase